MSNDDDPPQFAPGGHLKLTGNVAAADFPPTDQDVEVQRILHERLGEHLQALEALEAGSVAELNALLEAKGIEAIGG